MNLTIDRIIIFRACSKTSNRKMVIVFEDKIFVTSIILCKNLPFIRMNISRRN